MEQAVRARMADEDHFAEVQSASESAGGMRNEAGLEGLDKVLRFSLPGREGDETVRDRAGILTARDITRAMELIHDAARSIKAAEDRARDSELRNQALMQRAADEIKSAEARIQAAETRIRTAEARAQEAEARAKDAETWLKQIFTTLSEELPVRP